MKDLIIKIRVKDDIEAYQIVSKLSLKGYNINEARYKSKVYQFDKKIKSKDPRMFLRNDFGKKI